MSQARHVLAWLASRSVSRMRKGRIGDESAWFYNSHWSLKGYLKSEELVVGRPGKPGLSPEDQRVVWCRDKGVVRVELTLKRRLLSDLGLSDPDEVTDELLSELFVERTEILRQVERSAEGEVLAAVPRSTRALLAAWYSGRDVREMASRATLYRHARLLREYGINLMESRPTVVGLPVAVRLLELEALSVPEWYSLRAA